MDVIDEPQLFGAKRGDVRRLNVEVATYEDGSRCIDVWVHTTMRSKPMWLKIHTMGDESLLPILGSVTPLLIRSTSMSGDLCARTLWALHNKWGKAGHVVALTGAGKG